MFRGLEWIGYHRPFAIVQDGFAFRASKYTHSIPSLRVLVFAVLSPLYLLPQKS